MKRNPGLFWTFNFVKILVNIFGKATFAVFVTLPPSTFVFDVEVEVRCQCFWVSVTGVIKQTPGDSG